MPLQTPPVKSATVVLGLSARFPVDTLLWPASKMMHPQLLLAGHLNPIADEYGVDHETKCDGDGQSHRKDDR